MGAKAQVWGRVEGFNGGKVFTQYRTLGGWKTSLTVRSSVTGRYEIPLTYGADRAGTRTWRVGAYTPSGDIIYADQFKFVRTAVTVSATGPGSKPVGSLATVSGRVYGLSGGRVFTQVRVGNAWRTSSAVTTSRTGRYQMPLTYNSHRAGTYTWRVGARTPSGAIVYSKPFTLIRTPAPGPGVGVCVNMKLSVPNQWRAAVGARPVSESATLFAGACAWAKHLAKTKLFAHQGGYYGEVLARSRLSCADLWRVWKGSAPHYRLMVDRTMTLSSYACVRGSDGTYWAVGRMR